MDRQKAEALKQEANKLFSAGHYDAAIEKYSSAIEFDPTVAAYFSNRAFASIKLELYGQALSDATAAVELDPLYSKAYYRRAVAHLALGHLEDAIKDFKQVVKLDPKDPAARKQLGQVEKEKKQRDFMKAITFDEIKESILKKLGDIDSIVVEDGYKGPRIENNQITLDFVKSLMNWQKDQNKLHKKFCLQIMNAVNQYFLKQPSIIDIPVPEGKTITVCGDIHGQYYDLLNIFEINGLPSESNMYLFNGDFVDRGSFSVECILLLFAFKLLYPNSFFLSRGNHETDDMNRSYGFEGEVKHKYSELVFKFFSEIFDTIPIGNLIGGKILVVHGGLFSRDDVTMDEIRSIDRFKQPGSQGLMSELLWSDPQDSPGRSPSKRGVGLAFGPDVTKTFLENNGLDLIIRSHEVKHEGYEIHHDGKCITIFSAPNYCDSMNNKGAFIVIDSDNKLTFKQFTASPHPPVPPMKYASSLFGGMM